MIFTISMLALASVAASEAGTSCDAGDASCPVDPASGSMLMQIDHSRKENAVKHHGLSDVSSEHFSRLANRAAPNGFCVGYPCRASLLSSSASAPGEQGKKSATSLQEKQGKGEQGKTASLSQAGYEKVVSLKDDTEMKEFILRVIDKYDCKVESPGGLNGIVPWFSGTTMVQSLAKLEDALLYAVLADGRSASWLSYKNSDHVTGKTAEMSFVGYVQVAAVKNNAEMKNFVRRVCTDMGVKIVDEGGFEGMVKYYSGVDNFQSYSKLQDEIKSAANAPHSWADWEKKPAAASKNSLLSNAAAPRKLSLLEVGGFPSLAVRGSDGFCTGHPCRALLQVQPNSTQGTGTAPQAASRGMGKRVTLDQAGYAQVATLKDDSEMRDFILRMIEKYDCKVELTGGLMGIVPWFSGSTSTQDLSKLETTLLYAVLTYTKNPWLTYRNSDHLTGDTAKLGFVGYVQVAAMRNDTEMKKFVRRVCKDMGVQIVDEGGFQGMVKFYSGTDNFQSFDKLQSEIKSAANAPHAWAKWINTPKKM